MFKGGVQVAHTKCPSHLSIMFTVDEDPVSDLQNHFDDKTYVQASVALKMLVENTSVPS